MLGTQEKAPGWNRGRKELTQMKTNTAACLKDLPTAEIERRFNAVQEILMYETFGSDHEARFDLMDERSRLFRELKRRK